MDASSKGEAPSAKALGLPPIDQVAYMVENLDEAIERFNPIFGPFTTMEADNEGSLFRGEPHDVAMKIAFGRSGDLEVELIEHVEGESPHKDWIEQHGESIFHVRCKVEDVDARLAQMAKLGWEAIWYNDTMASIGIKYAYTQAPPAAGGHIIEFVQGF